MLKALPLLFILSVTLGASLAGDADPDVLYGEGKVALKLSEIDSSAIVTAATKFADAALIYEAKNNTEKAVEANSFLYWCKKKMTDHEFNQFMATRDHAVAQKLEHVDKQVSKSEAQTYFDQAEKFAAEHPDEHVVIAIRYFEVADRFAGTEVSLKAQKKSLAAQALALRDVRAGKDVTAKPNVPNPAPPATATKAANSNIRTARADNGLTLNLGNNVTLELVHVPNGTFRMGSENNDREAHNEERPAHNVTLTRDFEIGKYPVTVEQFRQFVEETKYVTEAEKSRGSYGLFNKEWRVTSGATWKSPGYEQTDKHPVVDVTWSDAREFCQWLSRKSGRWVQLPTEAQWEYAARGKFGFKYPWGNELDGTKCNHADATMKESGKEPDRWSHSKFHDGYVFASPVGALDNRSWCGAIDMAGNVWQWCQDIFSGDYYSALPEASNDPPGPTSVQNRVISGGCWIEPPTHCRSAYRYCVTPNTPGANVGFRVVVVPQD